MKFHAATTLHRAGNKKWYRHYVVIKLHVFGSHAPARMEVLIVKCLKVKRVDRSYGLASSRLPLVPLLL
ncbi:hypothetical protein HanHA300_Chr03g0082651 [Helianthus annuus]|nr:hypothetical protein HanHA300_Chr03g0082651 [Helianthus annuus]KAJ0607230.1 hypothetical protein HanHA89_Chr03g0094161 [Helianthus annuus]KAJ0767288.1 hypothetical protein HanLR1_Chr03g0087441 [Helianthus annuus]